MRSCTNLIGRSMMEDCACSNLIGRYMMEGYTRTGDTDRVLWKTSICIFIYTQVISLVLLRLNRLLAQRSLLYLTCKKMKTLVIVRDMQDITLIIKKMSETWILKTSVVIYKCRIKNEQLGDIS